MAGYDFLKSVTVIEVAQLGMDALGGYLADMGARVIKIEGLPGGDPIRFSGDYAVGDANGVGFLHLRWNRGKQSLGLNLRDPEGAALFRKLVARADVVIEGLKGGAFDRMGLGYETLRADNPKLVYCSLSGLGRDGPYHELRSHAVAYDVFAGMAPKDVESLPPAAGEFKAPSIGMHAPGLYAAVGVLSALVRARETGEGALIEVAAADAAANWVPDGIDSVVNADLIEERGGFFDGAKRMLNWARISQFTCADGRALLLEALSWPTWAKFCKLLGREDLLDFHERGLDGDDYHEALRKEIAAILVTRPLDEWMAHFIANDISAMPVNDMADLARDPHYRARHNWYEAEVPAGTLKLSGTPIRVAGAEFAPALAPDLGQHSAQILEDLIALDPAEIERLRQTGAIA